MATFTRNNAWNNGGTFANTDLLWYAKAVGIMQSRLLDDPTSWWFYASIHGDSWPAITAPPAVPSSPVPPQALIDKYWAQCQHGTWFFLPWHRGYLYAIENILREIVQQLGGPANWALPYWDYFGLANQYTMPPAFGETLLPDGSPNPLLVIERYGPVPGGSGGVYIPLAAWGINQQCQQNTQFVGGNSNGTSGAYGGGVTGFVHYNGLYGDIEWNPHNIVHSAIGGQSAAGIGGLMGDAETAALDPIFYLHHCNIDRMWAAWNNAGNNNPTTSNWLNGPQATADRKFHMPKPDKTDWHYTPQAVDDTSLLNYTYQDLSLGIAQTLISKHVARFRNFVLPPDTLETISNMETNANSELVGASQSTVTIDALGARTDVKLDPPGWNKVTTNLNKTFESIRLEKTVSENLPDEVYLVLEGVKGKEDSIVCTVSVNHHYAGHISLFGLRSSSKKDSTHGGNGLTIKLDITKIVDDMHFEEGLELDSLNVVIQPVNIVAKGNEITIDRIGIYRSGR